jgi:hypothetical protein
MKIIPVRQAGVLNFLGRQKMVTVPIRWKSGEGDKHPETELAYITKPEKEKLIKLDMHGSMKDGKPNFGPAGLISLNSGGDGGAGGDGGGGGGDGGNGDGGSDGGGSSGDSGSTGDGGSNASDTGDTGSESGNDAASASAAAGGSGSSSGGGDATDTGDMGSEAANDAATASANASVGANSSFGGYNPSRGFDAVSTGTANATDTGDLGSEAANDAATASGAASVGQGTFSAYSQIGTKMTNISNYMKGNPGTTLGLNAISLLTGIPGLALAYAVNSIYGTPSTNTSTSTSSTNSGGGNTYNASQISQILTQVANQYTGPSAAKNFAQKYPSSSQSGTLSFQSAYDTAKQNLGSLLTAPMSPYGNNAVSASPFYDYLKKNNLDRGIL